MCTQNYRHGTARAARRTATLLLAAAAWTAPATDALAATPGGKVTFQDHVRPILREHCVACHSQDDASSGLALDSYAATLAGGAGGEALSAGDADASRLWQLITHTAEPAMPPGDRMPDEQLAVIKRWIEGGLLDTQGSKPKRAKRSAVRVMEVTADNRPLGPPAMPQAWFRQPVVTAPRVGPVTALAASPWAPLVAVPWQRQVSLYRTDDLRLAGVLPYPDGAPRVVRFSRDGSLLLVAGGLGASHGSAAVFDVATGDRLVTVGDELDEVLAADISPDLSLVAIGGPKKTVRVFYTADGSPAYELRKHTDWVTALRFSPDGKLLATADRAAGLLVWQAASGNPRADLRGHKQAINAVDWRGDSAVLASAGDDGQVRLWRRDGQPIKNFRGHGGGATSVAFTRDGGLVTTGRDRKVTRWDAGGKAAKQYRQLQDMALAGVVTAEDKRVVAAGFDGEVRVYDLASGEPVGGLAANPPRLRDAIAAATTKREALAAKHAKAEQRRRRTADKLAAAEAAHAAFERQLAEAQSAAERAAAEQAAAAEAVAPLSAQLAMHHQAAAAATATRTAAENALKLAEQELTQSGAAPAADDAGSGAGGGASGGANDAGDADDGSSTAVVRSLVAAVAEAAKNERLRQDQLEEATGTLAAAELRRDQTAAANKLAGEKLAAAKARRQGLPNLEQARAAAQQTAAQLTQLQTQLDAARALADSLAAEQDALASRQAELTAAADAQATRLEQASRLQQQAEAALAQARAAAETQRGEADDLANQIAALQKALRDKRDAQQAAEQAAAGLADEAKSAAERLEEQQAEATRAAARAADHAAAEAARQKYLGPAGQE
ncbi:MAG: c-type cytochrome domain-containing protein [Planctomycetota bacterium]